MTNGCSLTSAEADLVIFKLDEIMCITEECLACVFSKGGNTCC